MSQQRFNDLYAANEAALYRFIWSLVPDRNAADDVIQSAMTQLWEHFDEYDESRPFYPWACRFAYRQVLLSRRRESVRRRFFSEATLELLSEDAPRNVDWEEMRLSALRSCYSELSDRQQELLQHRYNGDVPIKQVADKFGQAVAAIYKSLERTRKSLADCVNRKLADEGLHE